MPYKNFKLAIYCTAVFLNRTNLEELEENLKFFQKHLHVDKVYLETHRGSDDVQRDKMLQIKKFFEDKGIKTSGGITTTIHLDDPIHNMRIYDTFCYSDDNLKNRLKEIVEYTASIFDEIILDDFYFTSCSCPLCIEKKGDLSWKDYRLKLMTEVSQEYVVKPAKKVNPKVNMIIKYPNWFESYHENGYNPETQRNIFDEVYTGTETRDPGYTQQHLPKYLSYYLMRWFENVKPGKNKGGWFDSFECIHNIGHYLEQAYLTLFAKAREITLFDFGSLRNSVFIPPLGFELERIDNLLDQLGNPVGVSVYHPFHSSGEDHLPEYLGMVGIPFEPTPYFPDNAKMVFLAENASEDKDIIEKVKEYLLKGGNVILTSGFLKALTGKGVEELTSAKYTDKKALIDFFAVDTNMRGLSQYVYSREKILFPVIDYHTNSSWPLILGISGENNFPLLIQDFYGRGRVYILTVPDNYSDIYYLPLEVLNQIRKVFMSEFDVYLEGKENITLFMYDNDAYILESFLPYRTEVTLHTKGKDIKVRLEPTTLKLVEAK
ncbi:MAG TPA: permease [Dictyoglomaceae bacterium]|nr:permease [Dictyoglomaceae bacterium]HOL39839.1 permease [Dictyoglomaceae bacterium]HOP94437.1 permease [Dictyoglomaceae bacterium]HPP16317.1 permease [Dictyoglomaceae bacterium]HPU43554.1 permease [Dictyoglomaceae bacterium]